MANEKRWRLVATVSLLVAIICIVGLLIAYRFNSTTVILLVRHGERNDAASCTPTPNNPPISDDGETRADVLAHVGEDTGLRAIYASEFCRTQQTVKPLADKLGLPVNVVNQSDANNSPDVDKLISQIWRNNTGQFILIGGHSDTVPLIIEKLGGEPISAIAGTEFDNLYVVTVTRFIFFRRTQVIRLKYGAPT